MTAVGAKQPFVRKQPPPTPPNMGETAYSNSTLTGPPVQRQLWPAAPHDCYGGPYQLLCARRDRGRFDVSFIDQSDEVALSTGFAKKPALNACVASTG
jgi:hypothetical protein